MININDIIAELDVIEYHVSNATVIDTPIILDSRNTNEKAIFWCNDKNLPILEKTKYGTAIVSEKVKECKISASMNYIIVKNPREAFARLLRKFFKPTEYNPGISPTAKVSKLSTIGNNVFIGENVVIESGCTIDDNSTILHNTVIHRNTIIGKSVFIGCNNTIGGNGFGYEKSHSGVYEMMPHIGNVVLEEGVEIGNNNCIDRAVLGSTILRKNVKVDNLVHIAHGVVVGENTLVIAHAMIGGSTQIEKNVWIAPGALVLNKLSIAENSVVGMGAIVVKSVATNSVVAGNPAKFIRNNVE